MSRRLYPMLIDITDREVVVVGGGKVAERKVRGLLDCRALARVIAPEVTDRLAELASESRIEWVRREFLPEDLRRAFLVFAATNDRAVNHRVCQVCDYEEILVSRVDSPEASEFILPAVLRRGRLTISVSTGGASPALSRRIRDRLGEEFGKEYDTYTYVLESARTLAMKRLPDPKARERALRDLSSDTELFDLSAGDGEEAALERAKAIVERHAQDQLPQ